MEAYPERPKVLIVDDAPENIQLLADMLHDDCQTIGALDGVQALKLANDDPIPDVILLDIVMPGMSGYEVCTRLKSEPKTSDIPIIFVTAVSDKSEEHKGLEVGGADYITRPFNTRLVKTRIRYQLEIQRFRALHQSAGVQAVAGLKIPHSNLQAELAERKRLHQEVGTLTETLEAQLAAARLEVARLSRQHEDDQRELRALRDQVEQQSADLDRVSHELETFSYSISHDLRAPLRHLLGFSSALLEDYEAQLDETGRDFLGCITRAGRKLELQIEALTSLSRLARQPMNPALIDLSLIAQEVAGALKEATPDRRVEFSAPAGLMAHADAHLLRAALEHLLGNAWKFTRNKDVALIELGCHQEGDVQIFFLRDNGAGFDMTYAERLFGAFQRMHKESDFEGIGIGLATVQRIVHRHGGRIWAEAAVDEGCTFFFTLSGQNG